MSTYGLTSGYITAQIWGERPPPVGVGPLVSGRLPAAALLWRELGQTNPRLAEELLNPGVAPPEHWQVGDLTEAEKIEALRDFLAERFYRVCLNYHIVAPGDWGNYQNSQDVARDLKKAYPLFEPLVRGILENRRLTPEEVRMCHEYIGRPLILPVDAGTARTSLPVEIQDFGTPFQLFCQWILDINASSGDRPLSTRWCPWCRKPWPKNRNPKAVGCTPECSKELKRQKDKERYRKRKGISL